MYINHANETAFDTAFGGPFSAVVPASLFAQTDEDSAESADLEAPETKVVAILTACAMVLTFCTALTAIVEALA
jgi:hypothetical protein